MLTKNFAVNYGLGHYIYAGESYPQPPAVRAISAEGIAHIKELLAESAANFDKFLTAYSVDELDEMNEDQYIHAVDTLSRKISIQKEKK